MIGYTIVGVSDLDRARAFYDALLADIGGKRVMEVTDGQFYGFGKGPFFAIKKPYDGNAQHRGNGNMIALSVGERDKVHALHAKALALGGTDEGQPGPRSVGTFYGAYFRDLDGNKIAVYTMT